MPRLLRLVRKHAVGARRWGDDSKQPQPGAIGAAFTTFPVSAGAAAATLTTAATLTLIITTAAAALSVLATRAAAVRGRGPG